MIINTKRNIMKLSSFERIDLHGILPLYHPDLLTILSVGYELIYF